MTIFHFIYLALHGFPKVATSGDTSGGTFVAEGQRWNLRKTLHKEMRKGIYRLDMYYGDSVVLNREDGVRHLPQGCAAAFYTDILDDPNFELMEK